MSHKGALSGKQVQAVNSLLSGSSIRQAAQLAGVNARTLYRWMEEPRFTQALKDGESRILQAVGVRLAGLAGAACDVLSDILESETSSPGAGVRRLAAVNVLEMLSKWKELTDFEERLQALERGRDEKRSQA